MTTKLLQCRWSSRSQTGASPSGGVGVGMASTLLHLSSNGRPAKICSSMASSSASMRHLRATMSVHDALGCRLKCTCGWCGAHPPGSHSHRHFAGMMKPQCARCPQNGCECSSMTQVAGLLHCSRDLNQHLNRYFKPLGLSWSDLRHAVCCAEPLSSFRSPLASSQLCEFRARCGLLQLAPERGGVSMHAH